MPEINGDEEEDEKHSKTPEFWDVLTADDSHTHTQAHSFFLTLARVAVWRLNKKILFQLRHSHKKQEM